MNNIVAYLQSKNISFKETGGDQLVADCPICHSEGHWYIHKTKGLWDCKVCLEAGNIFTLKKELGDILEVVTVSEHLRGSEEEAKALSKLNMHLINTLRKNLMADTVVLDWLEKRGIGIESVRQFQLGLEIDKGGHKWIAIPYFQDKVVVNIKYRTVPPQEKAFRMVPNCPKPLYNIDNMERAGEVYLIEGEFDAIVLASYGFKNVVSVPNGAGNFSAEHYDALVGCKKIYLLYDNDVTGKKAAASVANRLDPGRCYDIKLPVNDVTDFFMKYGLAEFIALQEEVKPVDTPLVMPISDAFAIAGEEIEDTEGQIIIPWASVAKIAGPLQPGFMVIIQAIPKIGKTTFCLNLTLDVARQEKKPILFCCLEMTITSLLKRITSNVRSKPEQEVDRTDMAVTRAELKDAPFYFVDPHKIRGDINKALDTFRYAVKRFGIKLLVLDNIHFLCRSKDNPTTEIEYLSREFKLLFTELKIVGLLVAHPGKMNIQQVPGMYAARHSSAFAADADIIVSLFRKPLFMEKNVSELDFEESTATFEERTLVRVVATRFSPGGSAVLFFNGDAMRFEEYDKGY